MLNHIKVEGMHVQINSLKPKVQKNHLHAKEYFITKVKFQYIFIYLRASLSP